ncbi:MAG: hypothetical protein HW416_3418 [Chloroflexi bacterium]|nr:hypothetical protein [Chloroflexota bacterium]
MPKNIVICSDGTGNSWGEQISNVCRLVQSIELSQAAQQIAFYDQGIGTDPRYANEVKGYKDKDREQRCGLTVLDPPYHAWWVPPPVARVAGLAVGYGLQRNVRELYTALAGAYEEKDCIYLFGFSRGAFTVRVLAGLIFRCGLLPKGTGNFDATFAKAYDLYTPHLQDFDAVKRFKRDQHVREPCVHFLGLWDTVKSYGGIWPQSLPHLRHNPIIGKVRHGLGLDEQRSWFLPTSWGGIDSDRAMNDPRYKHQEIVEIWFRGCHSDVGGGYQDDAAARIPLRWMLNEASTAGLRLNQAGRELAASSDLECPALHESLTGGWLVTEYLPRFELDNRYFPPKRFFKCGRTGQRQPAQFSRQQMVRLHSSVGPKHDIVTNYVDTHVASSQDPHPIDGTSIT